ncbi:MAG: hypothetical protein HN525_03790 [Candidatus Marinimicrobia bacterium]|nr:hypothetical protein [Candidatus Neomarinimicrobiota bacterium]
MNEEAYSRQLLEAASWRIATELVRRYPHELYIYETHPAIYDCLSIFNVRGEHLADFNRWGSFHSHINESTVDGWDIWSLMVGEADKLNILNRLCDTLQLQGVSKLPQSNDRVKTYRFISDWLALKSFGVEEYRCRNASYYQGEYREYSSNRYFDHFPEAKERVRFEHEYDHHENHASRFWFLMKSQTPIACLESTGSFWGIDGFNADISKVDIRRVI